MLGSGSRPLGLGKGPSLGPLLVRVSIHLVSERIRLELSCLNAGRKEAMLISSEPGLAYSQGLHCRPASCTVLPSSPPLLGFSVEAALQVVDYCGPPAHRGRDGFRCIHGNYVS